MFPFFLKKKKNYIHMTVPAYTAVELKGWSVEWLLIDRLDIPISTGECIYVL